MVANERATKYVSMANNMAKSQTGKNKFNRLTDVYNAFELHPDAISTYKHIGLVDDVVTTGATLKGLLDLIKSKDPDIRITIFVLAVTK